MEKSYFKKFFAIGSIAGISAILTFSGTIGNTIRSVYGYGYGYGGSVQTSKSIEDSMKAKTDASKKDESVSTKDNSKKDETTTTKKSDRIEKEKNGKKYSITNRDCVVCANIANPDYNKNKVVLFNDITNSFYRQDILRLARVNGVSGVPIVSGTSKYTFEPNRGITRAEFLAIALASNGINVHKVATSTPFSDLKLGDWKTNVIQAALEEGIIYGDTKNGKRVFRPNDEITKIEALAILTSMRKINIEDTNYKHSYKDVAAEWQNRVMDIVEYLEVEPKSDKFYPNSHIKRENMAHYVVEVSELY